MPHLYLPENPTFDLIGKLDLIFSFRQSLIHYGAANLLASYDFPGIIAISPFSLALAKVDIFLFIFLAVMGSILAIGIRHFLSCLKSVITLLT